MDSESHSSIYASFTFSLNSVNEILFLLDNLDSITNNYPPQPPSNDFSFVIKQGLLVNRNNSSAGDR